MKKTRRNISAIALSAAVSVLMAMPAAAKPPHAKGKAKGHDKAPLSYSQPYQLPQSYMPEERQSLPQWAQQQISYRQAKSIALSRYPGAQYIDTYLNGNTYTVILLLPNTKKVKVKIDATSGRIR